MSPPIWSPDHVHLRGKNNPGCVCYTSLCALCISVTTPLTGCAVDCGRHTSHTVKRSDAIGPHIPCPVRHCK